VRFKVEFRCQGKDTSITTVPLCTEPYYHYTTFSSKITVSSSVTGWIQGEKGNNTATVWHFHINMHWIFSEKHCSTQLQHVCGPFLHVSHVAWSAGLCAFGTRVDYAVQNGTSRPRCRLGGRLKWAQKPCFRWGPRSSTGRDNFIGRAFRLLSNPDEYKGGCNYKGGCVCGGDADCCRITPDTCYVAGAWVRSEGWQRVESHDRPTPAAADGCWYDRRPSRCSDQWLPDGVGTDGGRLAVSRVCVVRQADWTAGQSSSVQSQQLAFSFKLAKTCHRQVRMWLLASVLNIFR